MDRLPYLLAFFYFASTTCLSALVLTPGEKGITVDGGGMMQFELGYPVPMISAAGKTCALIQQTVSGNAVSLRYEGGGQVAMTVSSDGAVAISYSGFDPNVNSFSLALQIGFRFTEGGRWGFDAKPLTPFPEEKPPKPFLFDANASTFTVVGEDGQALRFDLPPYTYNQLADGRAWDWRMFTWKMFVPLDTNNPKLKIAVSAFAEPINKAAAHRFLIDSLGQYARGDWPGKVKEVAELKSDADSEGAYYASFHSRALDSCGGLPDSGRLLGLTGTGYFHVEKKDGRWFLVDPEGNAFFHLGICCFSPVNATWVGGRESSFEWIPPHDQEYASAYPLPGEDKSVDYYNANLIRKYGGPVDPAAFAVRMIGRVRSWGFNSVGCFTGAPDLFTWSKAHFPYVAKLPCDPWEGFWYLPGSQRVADPFDEKLRAQFDRMCAKSLPPRAADPYLIGYFNENEPIYEDIPRLVPTLKGSQVPCKRKLVETLRDKYQDIAFFNRAWQMAAANFGELLDQGLPVSTPAAKADMQAYTELFLDTYFRWMRDTLHRYDQHHLLLGSRLQPGTINNEALCRIMGQYTDVVSYNYYTNGVDRDSLRRIYQWTGEKPMMLSEFFWSSPRSSGLPGGTKDLATQADRGLAYRNYVEQGASLGFVVGAEWFTLVDQPASGTWWGRYDGECANTGLFSVADRPWKPLVEQMAKTNDDIYDVLLGRQAPFVYANPRFQNTGLDH